MTRPLIMSLIVAVPLLVGACAPAAARSTAPTQPSQAPQKTMQGPVTYLERIVPPAGSSIEVSLDDVSRANPPATRVGGVTITSKGENVPIPFALTYDGNTIRSGRSYAVSARITIEGQLRWISTRRRTQC